VFARPAPAAHAGERSTRSRSPSTRMYSLTEPIDTYYVMYYSRSMPSSRRRRKLAELGGWGRGADVSGTAATTGTGCSERACTRYGVPGGTVCTGISPHRRSPARSAHSDSAATAGNTCRWIPYQCKEQFDEKRVHPDWAVGCHCHHV